MENKWPDVHTKIHFVIMGLLAILFFVPAFADTNYDLETIESVSIIGTFDDPSDVPGSVTVISNEDLQKVIDTDIHKILSAVPGVFFRTEDGYGLRPNISIRGTSLDRSGKITIMEDGVLVAPAPYTSASAYYFPTTGRIHAVEVLKGPAAITQGPSTIGGAINMISTPIPEVNGGFVTQEMGSDGLSRTHMTLGFNAEKMSGMVEVHEHSADGFDSIANVGGDTAFDKGKSLKSSLEPESVATTSMPATSLTCVPSVVVPWIKESPILFDILSFAKPDPSIAGFWPRSVENNKAFADIERVNPGPEV